MQPRASRRGRQIPAQQCKALRVQHRVYKKRIDRCLCEKTTWKGFKKEADDFWAHNYIQFKDSNVVEFQCKGE